MSDINNMGKGANYDKFVVDSSNPLGEGRTEDVMARENMGQAEFGVLGNYDPINCDPTRNTANDDIATRNIMSGGDNDVDDSEGGAY